MRQSSETSIDSINDYTNSKIDSVQSIVTWISKGKTTQLDGTLKVRNGEIFLRDDSLISGNVKIDMTSLNIQTSVNDTSVTSQFSRLFKSESVLNAQNYPLAEFNILNFTEVKGPTDNKSEVEQISNGIHHSKEAIAIKNPTHNIQAEFILKDSAVKFEVPAIVNKTNGKYTIESRLFINQNYWGIIPSNQDTSKISKYVPEEVSVGFYLVIGQ